MYGAILGDIVGSRFEFDRKGWTKDFELLTEECSFTDDSVMTVAIAEALLTAGKDAGLDEIKKACIKSMKKWGQTFPNAGYGGRFYYWVLSDEIDPYGSLGNGSAMRVSAAGWLYDSMERTREVARATAEVTHNHPEGIKGAECTAAVIFLARNGAGKEEIKDYVVKEFGYDMSKTLDEIRPLHRHDEACMDALPKALVSFMEGDSYEDVIRNAVSLGGDTDTIAAIAGAMGEAFFGMPLLLMAECKYRIEDDMREILEAFDYALGRSDSNENWDQYEDNLPLITAYRIFTDTPEGEEEARYTAFCNFMSFIISRINEGGMVPMPYDDVDGAFIPKDIEKAMVGDEVEVPAGARLRMDTMQDGNGDLWIPLFLNDEEQKKGLTANVIMPTEIRQVLKAGLSGDDVQGVVVNPFGKPFVMRKDLIEMVLEKCDEETN